MSRSSCNWSASASSWPGESSWTDAGNAILRVKLHRCGLGNGATSLTVQMREKSDRSNIDYSSYSAVVNHPWHIRDNNLTYKYAGPPAHSDTLPQTTVDKYKAATTQGAGKWNTVLGTSRSFRFDDAPTVSSADIVVQGYSSSGTDRCGGAAAVACVPYTSSTYPHVTQRQTLYFEYPPVSVIPATIDLITGVTTPARTVTYTWEDNFRTASGNATFLYMPIFMAHEFGHAAGLWHSTGASDAMNAGIAPNTQNLNSNDKKAMKALYDIHTAH